MKICEYLQPINILAFFLILLDGTHACKVKKKSEVKYI